MTFLAQWFGDEFNQLEVLEILIDNNKHSERIFNK
jgi:hypothetical protein